MTREVEARHRREAEEVAWMKVMIRVEVRAVRGLAEVTAVGTRQETEVYTRRGIVAGTTRVI